MTRTRSTRRTITAVPMQDTAPPDQQPLTRPEFDHAIAVLHRLVSFSRARPEGALEGFAHLHRSISQLELYRDWWTAPWDQQAPSSSHEREFPPAATARIEELEAKVRSWRAYSRRNEDRAKRAQRELDQMKTTRKRR